MVTHILRRDVILEKYSLFEKIPTPLSSNQTLDLSILPLNQNTPLGLSYSGDGTISRGEYTSTSDDSVLPWKVRYAVVPSACMTSPSVIASSFLFVTFVQCQLISGLTRSLVRADGGGSDGEFRVVDSKRSFNFQQKSRLQVRVVLDAVQAPA